MNIKYYKDKGKKVGRTNVFLVDMDTDRRSNAWPRYLKGYMPIGKYTDFAREFVLKDSEQISLQTYTIATDGLYTPEKYL